MSRSKGLLRFNHSHYEEATEDAEKAYNDLHNANVYRDKVEQLWWNNQFDNCMGECELPPYEEKYAIVGTRIVRVETERSKKPLIASVGASFKL